MEPALKTRIKICCIGSIDEAFTAIRRGADALGLVSEMPSGPGVISEDRIAEISGVVPPPIATFLLTSKQDVESVVSQQRRCRTNTIQLCDRFPVDGYLELREALPGISIVQVVHVTGLESIDEAVSVSRHVDAILLDSGNQNLAVKQLGGTGRTHNWEISRTIRDRIAVPLFLAGGLNPDNVSEAIRAVRPFGIDICSGVRTRDCLDEKKLGSFIEQIRTTDRMLSEE